MKSAKKAKKGNSFITVLVLAVLIAVLGVELLQLYGKLRQEERRATDEEFIKNKAREDLNMVEAGERIFIDVND